MRLPFCSIYQELFINSSMIFQDILEIQKDSIHPGLKCLIIDDLIATGGSIVAATKLLQACGANVVGTLVIIELTSLNGRKNIPEGIPVHSLITYD